MSNFLSNGLEILIFAFKTSECFFKKVPNAKSTTVPKPAVYAKATPMVLRPKIPTNNKAKRKGSDISRKISNEKDIISWRP